ncbi:MAG: tyrosine-protein phosphatase, partial [Lentisphaeria bacterium]|nr:tyrosine-protein phosphatase [Lentisphaeria bacterium]
LNYNSVDHIRKGRNRLMVEDITMLCDELGIKTDLDLRRKGETADLTVSPLGKNVRYIQISSSSYKGIHSETGKQTMINDFKVLADPKNHPIYFHCIGGYDRTGAVAFIANGVLGVSENDLASDWEQTTLPNLPDLPPKDKWRDYDGMVEGFYKYGKTGESLKDCIEKYLLSGGVTPEEIATFRKIMLVK